MARRLFYCSNCHRPVPEPEHRYCGWCGASFDEGATGFMDTLAVTPTGSAALHAVLTAHGGIYKRIDELREDYQFFQREASTLLADKPWIAVHWIAIDDYLVGLADAVDPEHRLGPMGLKESPPSPWPFPRSRPYDEKGDSH